MMPVGDLFVHGYVLVDDALRAGIGTRPARPGPVPVCSDAEVLTIALVRHLLGRPSDRGFLAEVRRDWPHDFPHLPTQSEFRPRGHPGVCWLWGAFEHLRQHVVRHLPEDAWQQVDTTARPGPEGSSHPSRARGPDGWQGPDGLHAGFGRDAAHGEWFSGFHLARRTDRQTRLVRAGGIVPAGAPSGPDERQVAEVLLAGPRPEGLLLDRGVTGRAWAAAQEAQGTRVVLTPGRAERRRRPAAVRRPGPEGTPVLRNRLETTNGELTERLGLARPGAKTFWGLLTRTAATILAHTLQLLGLV